MNPLRRLTLTALLASLSTLAVQAQTAPKVEAAWARPTVAGQAGGGGFVTIKGGASGDKLLSASAGVSKVVELHTMEMDGNVMRMRPVEFIEVPAGQTVELKPGGLHIMFMGLTQTLKDNPKVRVLANTGEPGRKALLAGVPSFHELGLRDMVFNSYYGLAIRAGTPERVKEPLVQAVRKVALSDEMKAARARLQLEDYIGTTDDYRRDVQRMFRLYEAASKPQRP